MKALAGVLLLLAALALAACGRARPPDSQLDVILAPTATPLPPPAGAEDEAYAVVAAEAEAVRQQDIDALASLWLPDGRLIDGNHTPEDVADDRTWSGWEQIAQRYSADVFPYVAEPVAVPRPRSAEPLVNVSGDQAEVLVPGPDGRTTQDRWLLRRAGGAWRIESLTFNLLPGRVAAIGRAGAAEDTALP